MTDLADALDLSLEVGELVQLCGGHTTRTIDSMQRMAAALGAQESDVAVSSVNVSLTVTADGRKLSAGRHAEHFGIDFSALTHLQRLIADTEEHGLNPNQVRSRLTLIRSGGRVYSVWIVMLALGASSAAFAVMFGATFLAALLTFFGGWAGAWVRHLIVAPTLKPFLPVACAAFTAALVVAGGGYLLSLGDALTPALAASTLFLVPGVPLLNGTADLLTSHYLNGLVKSAMSAVIIVAAAVGLSAAVSLVGALP